VQRIRQRSRVVIAAAGCALATCIALAARAPTDRESTEAIAGELKGQPGAEAAEAGLARATQALERASQARTAGDANHALLLEALALTWAEGARDVAQATVTEQQASAREAELSEAETRLTRARALVEETVARRNRAQSKLEQLERDAEGAAKEPKP
jgi:colicin import membrane protein